ncbi:hypothetical protein A1F97_09176 [Pyrenophora tritici-repentis]|nr:hypothetical protein L13192_02503 [Pyrenophora tritici-repentis]KAI1687076.1 hypothetical protein KJE20_00253 [Pyrenophora tritici-repentis]PZD33714.1 hypothetical protein A1F97_09176 [Pyrenophora tritici-repentis]
MTIHPHFAVLQKLRHLEFKSSGNFHWILAKSPALDSIEFKVASSILPDDTAEVNPIITQMTPPLRSDICIPENNVYDYFVPSLAHSPPAYPVDVDEVKALSPTLTTLIISVPDRGDVGSDYLDYPLSSDGSTSFKGLKRLAIPYQALFYKVDPQWLHVQIRMDELLPSALETLEVYTPEVALLDWLDTLPYYREHLPALNRVDFFTSQWFGDGYEAFVFKTYPHPAFGILSKAQISALRWSESLGRHIVELYSILSLETTELKKYTGNTVQDTVVNDT